MGVPDRFKKRWAGHVLPDHAAEMRTRHLAESGDSLCPARVPTFLWPLAMACFFSNIQRYISSNKAPQWNIIVRMLLWSLVVKNPTFLCSVFSFLSFHHSRAERWSPLIFMLLGWVETTNTSQNWLNIDRKWYRIFFRYKIQTKKQTISSSVVSFFQPPLENLLNQCLARAHWGELQHPLLVLEFHCGAAVHCRNGSGTQRCSAGAKCWRTVLCYWLWRYP